MSRWPASRDLVMGRLRFELTCPSCPEQYDVWAEDGERAGYVRLRGDRFRVYYPDIGGRGGTGGDEPNLIMSLWQYSGEQYTGEFDSQADRDKYLGLAAVVLEARHYDNVRFGRRDWNEED